MLLPHSNQAFASPRHSIADESKQLSHAQMLFHHVNDHLGVILTRCELIRQRSSLDAKSARDLRTIHDTAEAISRMLKNGSENSPRGRRNVPWLGLSIFLLGAGCGALVTRIHLMGLKSRRTEGRN